MRLMPQIRMESTMGQIGMRTISARQLVEQPKAILEIKQPPAEMEIKRTPGKLTIDQTQAWEDMNLKSIPRLMEEFAQNGRSQLLEGIARRAEEGGELMRIERGGSPIPNISKQNSEKPQAPINIAFIPSHFSVKINYDPGSLDIHWKQNKPIINVEPQKPKVEYDPGNVDIYVDREPSLKIDFVNLEV